MDREQHCQTCLDWGGISTDEFCLTERMGLETTMEQSWSGRVEKAVRFGGVPIEETKSSVHTGCIVRYAQQGYKK